MSESIGGETIMNTALKVLERKLEGSWKKIGDGVYVKAFNAWRVDSPKKYLLFDDIYIFEPTIVPKDLSVELRIDLNREVAYYRLISDSANWEQTSWRYDSLEWVVKVAEGKGLKPADDFMAHLKFVRDVGGFKIYRVEKSFSCMLFELDEGTAVIDMGDEYIIAPRWVLDIKTREEVLSLYDMLRLDQNISAIIFWDANLRMKSAIEPILKKNEEVLSTLAKNIGATGVKTYVRKEPGALVLELEGKGVKIVRASRFGGVSVSLKNGAELRVFNYKDTEDAVAVLKAQARAQYDLDRMTFHEAHEAPDGVALVFLLNLGRVMFDGQEG